MRLTSVVFPCSVQVTPDKEGFPAEEDIEWGSSYPAKIRDTTNRENVSAHQSGFDIDTVFVVMCYGGQNVLKDESDGSIYDIQRVYHADGTRELILECSRREPGCGYPGR